MTFLFIGIASSFAAEKGEQGCMAFYFLAHDNDETLQMVAFFK